MKIKKKDLNFIRAWNEKINNEKIKIYELRANISYLIKNDEVLSEILAPETQILLDKLNSLMLFE